MLMLLTIDAEYYFTVICKDSDKLFKDFNFAHRACLITGLMFAGL